MAGLVDRVRAALPRYDVADEIARGGMGAVLRGFDRQLQRPVAIKVLRPEIATAATAARFVHEARVLASLQHPHVVAIHEAGESDGLFFYVMDFIQRPTLSERLSRGPLETVEALKLGRDLLDALEAVHQLEVIHRDIKPANIFFDGGQTLLSDFGIAKSSPASDPDITLDGHLVGTPAYMAPEQLHGDAVTARTDLYAAAMVLYEAFAGRKWRPALDPRRADWSGIPRQIARALARGLAIDPQDRWPDAATFRRRIWRTRVRRYQWRAAALTLGGAVAGAVLMKGLSPGRGPLQADWVVLQIAAPTYVGPQAQSWLRDSVPTRMARLMPSAPDFRVCHPEQSCPRARATLRQTITATDSTITLRMESEGDGQIRDIYLGGPTEVDAWRSEVDRASDAGLRFIWTRDSPLSEWLPRNAIPQAGGTESWIEAEQALNQARWRDARIAFQTAVARDSTCLLCSWRITEIQRWLVESPDPRHLLRVRDAADRFPEHYQALIRVRWLPIEERLQVLRETTERWPGFPYAWFLLGEELFHRGPLAGHNPEESIAAFERTTRLDPTFGPAWEHLAWALIAAGRAEDAGAAVARYDSLLEASLLTDDFAIIIRALTELAMGWRFAPDAAADIAASNLNEAILSYPDLGAGPRLLGLFEARRGMVELAELLEAAGPPATHLTTRIAKILAYVAQGRLEESRKLLDYVARQHPEQRDIPLFALKLNAALFMLDSASVAVSRDSLLGQLRLYQRSLRQFPGAEWMVVLLSTDRDPSSVANPTLAAVARGFRAGEPTSALALTDRLPQMAETPIENPSLEFVHLPDPFYRTLLRFSRARWHALAGNVIAAADELLFARAYDLSAIPRNLPQAGEIDWAFGTLARWQRANLLRSAQLSGEACQDFQVVAARWQHGDPLFRARADSAAAAAAELQCAPLPEGLGW